MWTLFLLFCGFPLPGMADPTCTSSAKVSMVNLSRSLGLYLQSRGFLPAALSAAQPLGFGTCNESNGTCQTPPANCPDSSCCLRGSPRGRCGCAEEGLGPEWGDTACTDPKALRFAAVACDDKGVRHATELQLYAVPAFKECQDGATLQVNKEKGRLHVHLRFTLCPTLAPSQKNEHPNHRTPKGLLGSAFHAGQVVVGGVAEFLSTLNGAS